MMPDTLTSLTANCYMMDIKTRIAQKQNVKTCSSATHTNTHACQNGNWISRVLCIENIFRNNTSTTISLTRSCGYKVLFGMKEDTGKKT